MIQFLLGFGIDGDCGRTRATTPSAAFELAAKFADEWDQKAFDPHYDTLPLEHFEARLREVFAKPKFLAKS